MRFNARNECLTLLFLVGREQMPVHAVRTGIHDILFGYSKLLRLLADAGDKLPTRPNSIFFDGVLIHVSLLSSA
jgi:hypothetical protein